MDGVSAFSYLHMRGFYFRAHRDIRIYRVHSILVAMHGRSYTRTDSVRGDTSKRNAMYRSSGHQHAFYHVSYLYYRVLSSKSGVVPSTRKYCLVDSSAVTEVRYRCRIDEC